MKLSDVVTLPGSMAENGKGDAISYDTKWTGSINNPEWYKHPDYAPFTSSENIRFPFWLQPVKHYAGAAWYQKKVEIPDEWNNKHITLNLERCHWETQVWVNDTYAGTRNSLAAPHQYDLSDVLKIGQNTISICVDNRIKEINPGINSHSISDHTQSNWNGIVGDIYLEACETISLGMIQMFSDIDSKEIIVHAVIKNQRADKQEIEIITSAQSYNTDKKHTVAPKSNNFIVDKGTTEVEFKYHLGDEALLWDEFRPNLYNMTFQLNSGNYSDIIEYTFGLRDFEVSGTRFAVNKRPLFLRGTLECAIFPKTGYPPTAVQEWKRIYAACKSHGLNHVRFHSWCPPAAAFEAADQSGIYLQVECSSWANQGASIGDGGPLDQYIIDESERIVAAYGNHPSFCMLTYGNEPAGENQNKYLGKFVSYWKNKDSRRVYTSAAGWPVLPESDYHSIPAPRIQQWGEDLNSIINSESPRTNYDWAERIQEFNRPVISHEIGQWCVYPNFKEIDKYSGVLKAKNFELFRDKLAANHMGELADSFVKASGKLQALCYKADIEAALRTPGFAGFQLLDLHDFPGQGTALIGVLDPFWEEKGYITPQEYRRFCNQTVPLARLEKRIFLNNENFKASIEVAHFGKGTLKNVIPTWNIKTIDDEIVASGQLQPVTIRIGNCFELGNIDLPLNFCKQASQYELNVSVNEFENSWDIWIYPASKISIKDEHKIKIVRQFDNEIIEYLENGGTLLLSPPKGSIRPEKGGDVGIGFSSIFWNTAWTNRQKPHTLGILCNPGHPALAQFPTEYHSNWQWWDAMSHSNAINLNSFPEDIDPIIRVIDDWVTSRRLALVFEARVGKGRIIVSGIDLLDNIENRPEAQQLLYSLKHYMLSGDFNPKSVLTIDDIINLF
jgi:hypothetical protein